MPRLTVCAAIWLLLFLALSPSIVLRASQENRPSIGQMLAGRGSALGRLASCQGRFRIEIEEHRPRPKPGQAGGYQPMRIEGSWAMQGARFREETVRTYPGLTPQEKVAFDQATTRARVLGTAPASPPHGKVKRVLVFNGREGLLTQYQDGRR
jgi:hypothetical protein